LIYSSTNTRSSITELITGRDNSNNVVILDQFGIAGDAKRPQTRADVGATYMATDKFRISNTFTFDQFAVNGGEALDEALNFRNNAGTISTARRVLSSAYRVNTYQRYTNTIEADFQFTNWISAHLGYRYTKRSVDVTGYDLSRTTNTINPPPSPAPTPQLSSLAIDETEKNTTNTVIAGMKIKPTKNWAIFWDLEHGSADNVFTRLENYKYTNFRVRSRVSLKTVVFNLSAISKDNNNPSRSFDPIPVPFGADVQTRIYSGDVNWVPKSTVQFSAGYTYRHLTSTTNIRVIGGTPVDGVSQFFERDGYAYGEVSVKPVKRLSLFGTYRYDRDKGQGNRVATGGVQNIITSYPMQFKTPEVRAAIRLSRNVDWNIGYQYYDYKDVQTPSQNYRAHLPYTSLRIYLGGGAVDR
jgi:opacity protein-like surface antigen